MTCHRCKKHVREQKHCSNCGTRLLMECDRLGCNHMNHVDGDRCCGGCGGRLSGQWYYKR